MSPIKEKIDRTSWQPEIIKAGVLDRLISKNPEISIVDKYLEQLEELFLLRNPRFRFIGNFEKEFEKFKLQHLGGKSVQRSGSWFYYPWLKTVVHFLSDELHQEVRTGRNSYLITKDEQKKFYNSTIGIMGLSVGSHAALTIAMTGGGGVIRLADSDTLSGSNLNRIRTGFHNLGLSKVIAVARQIYEVDPYSKVEIFTEGVTEENVEKFIKGPPKLDVLVEEMDNPYFKFKAREILKKHNIALISAADNGDGAIVHIECYDKDKNLKLFNGLMGEMTADQIKTLDKKEIVGVIAKTVGADRAVLRMQESVLDVGTKLYSWPQLGTAANMCGTVLAYLARKLILGSDNIKSGIYEVNPDSIFESDYNSSRNKALRSKKTKEFLKKLGIKK